MSQAIPQISTITCGGNPYQEERLGGLKCKDLEGKHAIVPYLLPRKLAGNARCLLIAVSCLLWAKRLTLSSWAQVNTPQCQLIQKNPLQKDETLRLIHNESRS